MNHSFQVEYENNLTIRRYIFEVFNFYSTLVYIGFFKGKFNGYPGHHPRVFGVKLEDCPPGGELSLHIIFTKTTVALSYHRMRGLYFLAVVFAATIV